MPTFSKSCPRVTEGLPWLRRAVYRQFTKVWRFSLRTCRNFWASFLAAKPCPRLRTCHNGANGGGALHELSNWPDSFFSLVANPDTGTRR